MDTQPNTAPEAADERDDIVLEMVDALVLRALHIDLDLGSLAGGLDDDLRLAVGLAAKDAGAGDLGDGWLR